MKRFFAWSKYIHLLLTFLFVYVGPAECYGLENFGSSWHVVAAGVQMFQKKKTYKTFDNAKWMLSTIRVAPECRDTGGHAHLCHGTLAVEHTYTGDKRVHEKWLLRIEAPYLIFIPRVELHYTDGFLGSFHWRSRAEHFL
jgi:hypothetical protein